MANPFLVLGGVAVGIVVATFGILQVPGWVSSAQDASAISDLASISDAQHAYAASKGSFTGDIESLRSGDSGITFSLANQKFASLAADADGSGWCGVVQSDSGAYYAANDEKSPHRVDAFTAEQATAEGCSTASSTEVIFQLDTRLAGCTAPQLALTNPTATIDWGDGQTVTATNGANRHTYARPGTYEVTVDGTVPGFGMMGSGAACVTAVTGWGSDTGTTSTQRMFFNAPNVESVVKPPATLENMSMMFNMARKFNDDVSHWDVSNVKDMSYMFNEAVVFDSDLSKWDVSKVENMQQLFWRALKFNGDISTWDTGNVKNMRGMFNYANEMTSDLSKWDTGNVTDMYQMFTQAPKFDSDISRWNTENVTTMYQMFAYAPKFNADISGWKTPKVTDMTGMFQSATSFAQNLSGWDVPQVKAYTKFSTGSKIIAAPKWKL